VEAAGKLYLKTIQFAGSRSNRKPKGKPMPEAHRKANVARSKVRSAIEHVFAAEKHRFGLFVRTVGKVRAAVKIGMVNLVYNFSRLVWLEGRPAPA
jgi:IS5 family transposase